MSTYSKITRHPQTGKYELAQWIDDYFGHHIYGVKFPSDKKVYPTELVDKKKIKNFWADDVIGAFDRFITEVIGSEKCPGEIEHYIAFLNLIEEEYKARWKRDPIEGEGSVERLREFKKGIYL